MCFSERSLILALALAAAIGARSAHGQDAAHWRDRRLIVVIWERRAPQTHGGTASYGTVQKVNRETVLGLLYDGRSPLVTPERGDTAVAIYPEGLQSAAASPGEYAALYSATAQQIAESWLPRMTAPTDGSEVVRSLHFAEAPERAQLDVSIRKWVTYPLVGLPARDTDFGWIDETSEPTVSPSRKAVSQPPLVTPWAIHDAATRMGTATKPFTEIYVIWVHGGERNYAVTIPRERIRGDYGAAAAQLYGHLWLLYAYRRDETRAIEGEFAGGNVALMRVVPRAVEQSAPASFIRDGRMLASYKEHARTLDLSMLGDSLARRQLQAFTARFRWPHWTGEVSPPGYQRLAGRYVLAGSGKTAGMTDTGAVADGVAGLAALAGNQVRGRWVVDEEVYAEMMLRAPDVGRVPPYVDALRVDIPIRVRTPVAPLFISVTTVDPRYTYAIAMAAVTLIVYLVVNRRRKRKIRMLAPVVDWAGPGGMEVVQVEGPKSIHKTRCTTRLLDRSPFRPWSHRLTATADVELAAGTIPCHPDKPLLRVSMADSGKPLQAAVTRANGRPPMQIEVALNASAIDFARIEAGDTLADSFLLRIRCEDRKGRYAKVEHVEARRFELRIVAAKPTFQIRAELTDVADRFGIFADPLVTPLVLAETLLGRFVLENPAPSGGVALDVTARLLSVHGTVEDGSGRVVAQVPAFVAREIAVRRSSGAEADDQHAVVANGKAVGFNAFIRLPKGSGWVAAPHWKLCLRTEWHLTSAGQPEEKRTAGIEAWWHPVGRRSFVCLDLGTSATRILVQDDDPQAFGFLQFPANIRGADILPEDLPSTTFIDVGDDTVLFGSQAIAHASNVRRPANLYSSLKELMMQAPRDYTRHVELFIQSLLTTMYEPEVHHRDPEHQEVEVINPYKSAHDGGRISISRGARSMLIATIPNETPPAVTETYRKAVDATGLFRRFFAIREAEAAALWYAEECFSSGKLTRRPRLRVLAVDIGAGTTDAALVDIEADRLRVSTRGGGQFAGKHVDRAVHHALQRLKIVPEESPGSAFQEIRRMREAEKVKIALGTDRPSAMYFNGAQGFIEIGRPQLDAISGSTEYQRALRDMIDETLAMLLGRVADPADAVRIDTLLLTGRGALIHGVIDRVKGFLRKRNVTHAEIEINRENGGTFLKAGVSLGARAFASGPWQSVTLSGDVFPDRIVFVAETSDGPAAIELVPAGVPFVGKRPIRATRPIDLREWHNGVIVRTFLRLDDRFGDDLRLTGEAMTAILRNAPVGGYRTRAYSSIGEISGHTDRPSHLRVTITADGDVRYEPLRSDAKAAKPKLTEVRH
jgi:hypothetical protein